MKSLSELKESAEIPPLIILISGATLTGKSTLSVFLLKLIQA